MATLKATILAFLANIMSFLMIGGGIFMTFFDDHYKGIGAICLTGGLGLQWYFKSKAHKEIERHNREIEKGT